MKGNFVCCLWPCRPFRAGGGAKNLEGQSESVKQGSFIDTWFFYLFGRKLGGIGIPTCPLSSNGPAFRWLQVSMEVGFFRNGHVVFFCRRLCLDFLWFHRIVGCRKSEDAFLMFEFCQSRWSSSKVNFSNEHVFFWIT